MPRPSAIVAGFVHDGLGLGEAARGYAEALAAAGWDVRQHAVAVPGRAPGPARDPIAIGAATPSFASPDDVADVLLLCLNPPELEALLAHDVPLPAASVHVAVWAWEADPAPESWGRLVARFDAVWAYSTYVRDLLAPLTTGAARLHVVPPPVRAHGVGCASERPADDADVLLTVADAASSLVRKNPAGAIDAFCAAFAPGTGPRLVVKVWDNGTDAAGVEQLCRRVDGLGRSDIEVLDRFLPRDQMTRLLGRAAGLVALHRSEGFGLPIFEALAAGVPVVASACAGPMDLLDHDVAFLVPATPTPVAAGCGPYPAGAQWFEPSIEAAADHLRQLWQDRDGARRRAQAGRRRVHERLSLAAVGARMDDLLRPLLAADPSSVPARPWHRSTPAASVVVHAAAPWPALRPFLDAVVPQVRALEAELVVAATDGAVLPDDELPPRTRRVEVGSTSPFALRAAGLAVADGELLVVAEDHTRPDPGWLAAYSDAHRASGGALFTGPIGNGSTATRADWASYLVNFASFAPPVDDMPTTGHGSRMPTIANCAVSRIAFDGGRPRGDGDLPPEWFERELVRHLHLTGQTVIVPTARVDHVQPFPFWRHLRNHFDDCRCDGAHTAATWPESAVPLRPRALLAKAEELLRDITDSVTRRPALHAAHRRAAWHLRTIAITRALAQAVGARWGAGRSATRLD